MTRMTLIRCDGSRKRKSCRRPGSSPAQYPTLRHCFSVVFSFVYRPPVCENYSPLKLSGWRRSGVDRQAEKRDAPAVYEGSSKNRLFSMSAGKHGADAAIAKNSLFLAPAWAQSFQLNARPAQSGRRIVRRLAVMPPVPESVPHLASAFRQFRLLFRAELAVDLRHYATVQQGQLRGHLTVLGCQLL